MATYGTFEHTCEQFDRDYESKHAGEIALEQGRINWDTITPENAGKVIVAATVGLACRVLELSVGGRPR